MNSLQGHFLVASPHLSDGNFYRSVVLMIKHDDEGAFGLILNRPTTNTVQEVLRIVAEQEVDCEQPIYVGGPVSGPLVALHRMKSASEAEVLPGVHFAAHKEQLLRVASKSKKPFRMFSGYSGWSGGQLEGELKSGGWLILPATIDLVFDEGEDLWDRIVRRIGGQFLETIIKTRHVPENPSLN
ncbi:MAG: YqgE/AlgH family protein [Pirellulaceae bacterium]|nr:YqgE/AlgH family protein [Pirellulaceae bacterium]